MRAAVRERSDSHLSFGRSRWLRSLRRCVPSTVLGYTSPNIIERVFEGGEAVNRAAANEGTVAPEVVIGRTLGREHLGSVAPASLLDRVASEPQRAYPAIAKDSEACDQLRQVVEAIETRHVIRNQDCRELLLAPESVD